MSGQQIDVFVYGTLKRGERNHDGFCSGALRVSYATVGGRLYDLPFGFPALVVSAESILDVGTTDYLADAEKQRAPVPTATPIDGDIVNGELFTFDDALDRLPALDGLEGFRPDEPKNLYRRVLIPVHVDGGTQLAWAYAIEKPSGEHLPDGRWPR